jgi:NAD(P)-dependent dehydrogenase (short-subunit alcohol dehydrogenase family)
MDGLERLIAIEDIKQLEAKRGRLLDTQDWAGLAALHIPDLAWSGGSDAKGGVEGMVAWLAEELAGSVTVHHVHSPEIEFVSADHAKAIWAMEAMTTYRRPDKPAWRHGFGYYRVDYHRRDGVWKIGARTQERLRVDSGGLLPPV